MNILEKAKFPDNRDYHASGLMSSTKLKAFMQSPKLYHHLHVEPGEGIAQSPAMKLGSMVHSLFLTPRYFSEEFQIRKPFNLRTSAGKKEFIEHLIDIKVADYDEAERLKELKADELRSLEDGADWQWITQAEYDQAWAITDYVLPFVPIVSTGTEPNTEAAFTAEIEGVQCQCKADLVCGFSGTVWDLKTTGNLDRWLTEFDKGAGLIQDTFYRMVIEAATGERIPPIRYVGVSTAEPYDVAIRYYPADLYEPVSERIRSELVRYKQCVESDTWPGVEGEKVEPKEAHVKSWVYEKYEPTLNEMFGE